MKNDIVSIIVPVYNVEKYLDRCVESIVNQTYRNLEIVLVDDGSPDRCPQMCDEWAKKDSRIKVIHKENQGLGIARNTGIEHATGSYICFFDSDDYIALDTIEQAYKQALKESADIVLFGMSSVDVNGNVVAASIPRPSKLAYTGKQVQEDLLPEVIGPDPKTGTFANLSLSACRALYSQELIKQTKWRFVSEREILSEDIYSVLGLYAHIKKAAVLQKALYFYRENNGSVSRTYRPDRYSRNRHFYTKCLELCKECGYSEDVIHRCSEPFLRNTIAALKQETVYHDRRTAVKHLKAIIDDDLLQQVLRDKKKDKMNLKKRILFWAIRNRCYQLCYALLIAKSAVRK